MFDPLTAPSSRMHRQLVANGLILLAVLAWWLTSLVFPPRVFPSLGMLASALYELITSSEFWLNAAITFGRIVLAILAATFVGGLIGILPRYLPITRGIVDNVLVPFFSSFPGLAWAILGTVWFGVTSQAVIFVQFLIILPFSLVNIAEGAKAISAEEVEMGRSFTRRRRSIFWRIELPLLSPFLISAVTISYGVCWKISLIAELFGARSGIGFMMQNAQDLGQTDRIIALCLMVVAFVAAGEKLVLHPLASALSKGEGRVSDRRKQPSRAGGASET